MMYKVTLSGDDSNTVTFTIQWDRDTLEYWTEHADELGVEQIQEVQLRS